MPEETARKYKPPVPLPFDVAVEAFLKVEEAPTEGEAHDEGREEEGDRKEVRP